eukprot:4892868-Pyramimonas_sp.AAC.1
MENPAFVVSTGVSVAGSSANTSSSCHNGASGPILPWADQTPSDGQNPLHRTAQNPRPEYRIRLRPLMEVCETTLRAPFP